MEETSAEETNELAHGDENSVLNMPPPQVNNLPSTTVPNETTNQITAQQIAPQGCGCSGSNQMLGFAFAIGNLQPIFSSNSIQNEFSYACQQANVSPVASSSYYEILSQAENFYIAKEMCWLMQISGIDSYIVHPKTDAVLYDFIDSLNPAYLGNRTFDVIIGTRGPVASPQACNGLQLPVVSCELSYHFTFDMFVTAMRDAIAPGFKLQDEDDSLAIRVQEMLEFMLDKVNSEGEGATDSSRVINYLTIRVQQIYEMALSMHMNVSPDGAENPYFLNSISVQPSRVNGNRNIQDVIFEYVNNYNSQSQWRYLRVDISGKYPFLVTAQLEPYYPSM